MARAAATRPHMHVVCHGFLFQAAEVAEMLTITELLMAMSAGWTVALGSCEHGVCWQTA